MNDIEKRLDEYIEFAEARKCFSDVGFYRDVKVQIVALKQRVGEMAANNRRYEWISQNVTEVPLERATIPDSRYEFPQLISCRSYCGPITLDEAIDIKAGDFDTE